MSSRLHAWVLTGCALVGCSAALASNVSGSMTVSGTFAGRGSVNYAVVLNNTGSAQPDNPSNEFIITLPTTLTLVSATSSSGVAVATIGTRTVGWSGPIAAGASVVTIGFSAVVNPVAPGTLITAQGTFFYDADGNGVNEAVRSTDDPATFPTGDATSFTAIAGTDVRSTMSVAGDFFPGGAITYGVVLTNYGVLEQPDNPSNEFIVTLPVTLELLDASASQGSATANPINRAAAWTGSIAVGASVTISIEAMVDTATVGSMVNAQGATFFDRNGDGVNEASLNSDDPSVPGDANPTTFVVVVDPLVFADGFEG